MKRTLTIAQLVVSFCVAACGGEPDATRIDESDLSPQGDALPDDLFAAPSWTAQPGIAGSGNFERFGFSVAVSGDTAVVGAPASDGNPGASGDGAAFVYVRSAGAWELQQMLWGSDADRGDEFGWSVAIDGDTVIVGAPQMQGEGRPGAAYVFTRSCGLWTEEQKLADPDPMPDALFGYAVSLSGDSALVGAARHDTGSEDAGAAYVFTRSAQVWTEEAALSAPEPLPMQFFGSSVDLQGSRAILGAPGDGPKFEGTGSAFVFDRSGGTWNLAAELIAPDATKAGAFVGYSVALDGDTALVASPGEQAAYVFERSAYAWSFEQELEAPIPEAGFATAVDIDAGTIVVGAPFDGALAESAGAVSTYVRSDGAWDLEETITKPGGDGQDLFGFSVAIDSGTAVVGAVGDYADGAHAGSASVFAGAPAP